MIRCPSCGSQNYAIDIWCSACSQHLDWAPHARNPTGIRLHRSARAGRSLSFLAPVAAALGVAIALAMPVASWFNAAGQVAAPSVFEAAAALWTPVMQAQYPPAEYIDQRFAATEQLDLRAERVVGDSGGVAVVYVDVVEVIGGQMHHWVGTWQLVDTSSGWLLNRPNLRPTA